MSYQIQYPVRNHFEEKYKFKDRKIPTFSVMAILCVILLIVSVHLVGFDALSEFIIPGNNAVTTSAFQQMQDNISSGVPIGDAITAFCTEIIESANIQ